MKLRILVGGLLALGSGASAGNARAQVAPHRDLDVGGTRIEMVLVRAGSVTVGSPEGEKGREPDEHAHEVTLTKPFYMGKYPITRGQFDAFASATGYRTEAEKGASGGYGWNGSDLVQAKEYTWKNPGFSQTENDPVVLVTATDAEAFARWAGSSSSSDVSLPTEAQWEYAARAGTMTPYYDGASTADALAIGWFKPNAQNATHPVGQKKPNAFGLYDMSGNVFEWCRDWYAAYPESASLTDPMVDDATNAGTDKRRRVLRGGSWHKDPRWGRSAARYKNAPGSRNADNGFRVVMSARDPRGAADRAPMLPVPPAPPPVPRSAPPIVPASGVGSFSPLLVLVGGGGLAILLAFLLRGRGRRSGDVGVRIGEDGFWINGGLPAGSRVKYACVVRGMPVTDTVGVDGGPQGTFVYTGGAPVNVRILEVTTVRGDVSPIETETQGPFYRGSSPRRSDPPPAPPPPPPDPTPFGGFPPAY